MEFHRLISHLGDLDMAADGADGKPEQPARKRTSSLFPSKDFGEFDARVLCRVPLGRVPTREAISEAFDVSLVVGNGSTRRTGSAARKGSRRSGRRYGPLRNQTSVV